MTTCPACSYSVTPNDLTCPKCRITLYHEQAGGGQSPSEGGGSSLLVVVGIGFVGIIALLLCAGGFATSIFFSRTRAVPAAAGSSMMTFPAGTIEAETGIVDEAPEEGATDAQKAENLPQSKPRGDTP